MKPPDEFSAYYARLLEGSYDCVDRIVINAYFPMGQTGGGLRTWWRQLHGTDAQLNNDQLRDMAGTFSRRVRAFCAKQGIPFIEAEAGERKHEIAESHQPKTQTSEACSWSSPRMRQRRCGRSSVMSAGTSSKCDTARSGLM